MIGPLLSTIKQLDATIHSISGYLLNINQWRSHLEVLRIKQTLLLFAPQTSATKGFIELLGGSSFIFVNLSRL
jgi:hypothetical protein